MNKIFFWFRYWIVFGGFFVGVNQVWASGPTGLLPDKESNSELANKLISGEIHTSDIPKFILHMVEYLLMIVGGICVVMIMVGGVRYIVGSITENKDGGKQTIQYALIGLVVAFLSWFVVDQIQQYLTSAEI